MISPILLDAQPSYMSANGRPVSLLLAPVGSTRLATLIQTKLAGPWSTLRVLTTFEPTDAYRTALRKACPSLAAVMRLGEFRPAEMFEPSDWLLFIDPRYCSLDSLRLSAAFRDVHQPRSRVTHLVAMS